MDAVDLKTVVPPELPLEALNLENGLPVEDEREAGVVAVDLDVTRLAGESGARGVEAVGKDVFLLEEEELGGVGPVGLGLGVGLFGGVAEEEGDAVVNYKSDVEGGEGLWGRGEFGFGEVPEEVGVGAQFLGAVFFPEEEGSYVKVEGEGVEGVVVLNLNVEGPSHHGAGPRDGDGACFGVVHAEVGGGRVRRRRSVEVRGGGGTEA